MNKSKSLIILNLEYGALRYFTFQPLTPPFPHFKEIKKGCFFLVPTRSYSHVWDSSNLTQKSAEKNTISQFFLFSIKNRRRGMSVVAKKRYRIHQFFLLKFSFRIYLIFYSIHDFRQKISNLNLFYSSYLKFYHNQDNSS